MKTIILSLAAGFLLTTANAFAYPVLTCDFRFHDDDEWVNCGSATLKWDINTLEGRDARGGEGCKDFRISFNNFEVKGQPEADNYTVTVSRETKEYEHEN